MSLMFPSVQSCPVIASYCSPIYESISAKFARFELAGICEAARAREPQRGEVEELYEGGSLTVLSEEGEEFVFEFEEQQEGTFAICVKKDNELVGVVYARGNVMSRSFESGLTERFDNYAIKVMPEHQDQYKGTGRALMSLTMGISKYIYGYDAFIVKNAINPGFYVSMGFEWEVDEAVCNMANKPLPAIRIRRKLEADVILEHEKDEFMGWTELSQSPHFGGGILMQEFRERYIKGKRSAKAHAEITHNISRGSSRLHDMFREHKHLLNWDSLWEAYREHGFDEDDDDVNIAATPETRKKIAIISPLSNLEHERKKRRSSIAYGNVLEKAFNARAEELGEMNDSTFTHEMPCPDETPEEFAARIKGQYDLVIIQLHGAAKEEPVAFEDFGCKTMIVVHRSGEVIERCKQNMYPGKDWRGAFKRASTVVLTGDALADTYKEYFGIQNIKSIPYGFEIGNVSFMEDKHLEAGVAIGSRTLWSEMRRMRDVIAFVKEVKKDPRGEKVFGYIAGLFETYKDPESNEEINEVEELRNSDDCKLVKARAIKEAFEGGEFKDLVSFKEWLYQKSDGGAKVIIVEGDLADDFRNPTNREKELMAIEAALIDFSTDMFHETLDKTRPKVEYPAALHRNPGSRMAIGFESGCMKDLRSEGLGIIEVGYRPDGTMDFSSAVEEILGYVGHPDRYNAVRRETYAKAKELTVGEVAKRYLELSNELIAGHSPGRGKGSPADCLENIRDNGETLLRDARDRTRGVTPAELRQARGTNPDTEELYHPNTIYRELKILGDLGILVRVSQGHYCFTDIMIGEDENFTKTLINAVNDIRHQVGTRGNEYPLHRGSIPTQVEIDTVRELVAATIVHQVNLMQKVRSIEEGVEEVYFSEGYLAFVESRLRQMDNPEASIRGVIKALRSGLKDREDHWFYTRLVRLLGIQDERRTVSQEDRYYGKVQFTKNARKLERVLNSVTPVFAFNTDDTLDRGRRSLSEESAERLAALICNGRKVQITSGKSLEQLGELYGDDDHSVELYSGLRNTVIEKIREEGRAQSSVTVADDLLAGLFEMILDTGTTRLFPGGSAENQNELMADTDFQRSIPAKLASRIERKMVGDQMDARLQRVIAEERQKLVREGYTDYRNQDPVLRLYGMPSPDGGRVITKIKFQPFGDVVYDRVGNPARYRVTMEARLQVVKVLEDIIKEMIPEEERQEGVSFLPVAAGSSSVDLNLVCEGKAIQKDRGILLQKELGHTEVNYFDNTAFSGNGRVVTQLRQEIEYDTKTYPRGAFRLNVFAVDMNLPEGISPKKFKGVTYLGRGFDGTADHLRKKIREIESEKPSTLKEEGAETAIEFSGEYLSKVRQRAASLGLGDETLEKMMAFLDVGITRDVEHWFYAQVVKIFGISDERIPDDRLVIFQGFEPTREDIAYNRVIHSVISEVKEANSTVVITADASIFNFSHPYLKIIEELLERNGIEPEVTGSIMSILEMGLYDDQDHWFYTRLIRLLGLFDMRQAVDGPKKYHRRAELIKNDGYQRKLINAVTTVYSFDKDDTLDRAKTSLRGITAEKLAALIANGRKVAINTARVVEELAEQNPPMEIYKPLRDAVIERMKKEGWGSLSEAAADDLLWDLCVLYLGTGISRMLPAPGVRIQADLIPDEEFQRGFSEEVVNALKSRVDGGDMDAGLRRVIDAEREKLIGLGYADYANQEPEISVYNIEIPVTGDEKPADENEPAKTRTVITKIKYQPFGDVTFSKADDLDRLAATRVARGAVKVELERIFREIGLYEANPAGDYAILPVVAGTSSIDFNMLYRGERIQKDRAIRYEFIVEGHKKIRYFDDEAFKGNAASVTEYCRELQAEGSPLDFKIFSVDHTIPSSVLVEELEGLNFFERREETGEYLDGLLGDIEAAKPSVIREETSPGAFSGEATIAPEKRVLCHIISGDIIPEDQKQMVQELEQQMRGSSDYQEKIVKLDLRSSQDFISALMKEMDAQREHYSRQGYSVEFDVAVHDASLVSELQENLGIDALSFSRPEGDFAQLEAIVLALRALKTQRIDTLRRAFELISGRKLDGNELEIDSVDEFARRITFILPSASIRDIQEIGKLNAALKKFILSAA